ncbi:MAG: aa3-type cytochrome oxidase subunit II [Acidimicrobiales bacterium]
MSAPRVARRLRWTAVTASIVGLLVLTGCEVPDFGAHRGATTQGQDTFRLWQGSVIAALVVGVIVWGLIFYVIIRFRKRDDEIPSQHAANIPLEIGYTVVPLLIVAGLFYFTATTQDRIDTISANPAVRVEVTAYQWGWKFQYTGTPVTISTQGVEKPTLVLPVNQTTRITLQAVDVVHNFFVPEFLFKRDATPGLVQTFDLHPVEEATFLGHCAEFCGLRHADMLFDVSVVSPADYSRWLSQQEARVTS